MKTTNFTQTLLLAGWLAAPHLTLFAQSATNVTQLIHASQGALAAEHFADAERLARSAVDLDPAHPPAWRQYGLSLWRGGKAPEAVTALQRAVSMDENDATAWRGLAQAAWQAQRQNEAVRALSAYLRLNAGDAAVWRDLSSWLTQLGRGDEAIAALQRVVELKPDDGSAWRELGAWLTRLERSEQAVSALERAVRLRPDDAAAWRELALGQTRLQRNGEAVSALERVAALKPDDASAWSELAAGLSRQDRHEQAVTALERAAALGPENAAIWRELASARTRLRRYEQAVTAYEKVAALKPDDAAAWHELASGLTRLERYEQAVAALEQTLKLKPDDAPAWRELALLHQRGGRGADAAKAFERALAMRPDDAATLRDLGWVLWTLGRRDAALARLTEAVEAGVEARDRVVFQAAARLSEEGAGDQALAFLRRVNPNDPPSVVGLALARAGRLRAAEPILTGAWQAGERTPDVGLSLAYSRAVNGQFSEVGHYLAPLLREASALSTERADLALETLRLGSSQPEVPALLAQLESVLDRSERTGERVTDILELAADASRARSNLEQALRLYRRVLERDPNRTSWIWAALLAERAEGTTPDAWLSSLEKRTSSPARQAGIKGLRADRQGRAADATVALRQSLDLDPQQPQLRQILFDSLLAQGRSAEARAEADWFARQVEAGETALRSYLAEMLTRLGDIREALLQWEALHQTNPEVPYYATETAQALVRLGRADEATGLLKTMLQTTPDHRIFEQLAEIASAQARTAESVAWASRGLAADPSPGLLRYAAEGLETLGTNAPAALAAAQAYLAQDPGHVPLTLLAGRMMEAAGATNEVRAFHLSLLERNPVFVPSLLALRDSDMREGRLAEAAENERVRADFQPRDFEAERTYASLLAQQNRFRPSLSLLRPLAKVPLEQAFPVLVYSSIVTLPYAGRNSVDQISRHIARLAADGFVFVNAFSQLSEAPQSKHVMIVLLDPEADVIEALDPALQKHHARVVYAGNAAAPALTLSGLSLPERLAPVLASGRWQLASGGPADFRRLPVNAGGTLGNPLTHPAQSGSATETAEAFSARIDQALAGSARALKQRGERILVYPSGDFGQRSLDAAPDNLELLHRAVARHFTHGVFFDNSGFAPVSPDADPLRLPARAVPPDWDETALSAHVRTGHPLARARFELARVLYWNGQHEAAHAAFLRAAEAGASEHEVAVNMGLNADREGDLAFARQKLLEAQATDPESVRIRQALERLDARRRPQATLYLYGWKDSEDRDHYRYGAYGDAYVSERVRLGVLADRDRWSTDGVGSEYGTRYGLRGLAYLAPQVWLSGSLWQLDMDNLKDHWGGDLALRLPNPWLSGYVTLAASREEIETVEALRANIDANTYALRTYTRLRDTWDLFADLSQIERSDGNSTSMLDGRLLYRISEWPYIGAGWRFRFADSDRDPPEYWAPERLEQHQAHITVRGAWGRLSGAVSAEAGVARQRDTDWQFVWGARAGADYALTQRFSLSGELGYFESPNYERLYGRLAVTGRF